MASRNLSKYERAWRARRAGVEDSSAPEGFVAGGGFDVTVEPDASVVESFRMRPGDVIEIGSPPADNALDEVMPEITSAAEAPIDTAPDIASDPPAPLVAAFTGSSNVTRAELDVTTGIVTVRFKNGPSYRYGNFTPALLEEWRAAPSAGRWFHGNVKSKPAQHPQLVRGPE